MCTIDGTFQLPGPAGWLIGFLEEGRPVPLLAVALDSAADWSECPLAPRGLAVLGVYSVGCPAAEAAQQLAALVAAARGKLPAIAQAEASGFLLCAASSDGTDGTVSYFLGKALQPTEVLPLAERRELFASSHVALRARLSARLPMPSRAGAQLLAEQLRSDRVHFDFPDARHVGVVAASAAAAAGALLCAALAGGAGGEGDEDDDEAERGAKGPKGKKGGGKAKGGAAKKRPGAVDAVGAAEAEAAASAAAAEAAEAATRQIFSARVLLEASAPAGGAALSLSLNPAAPGGSSSKPRCVQLDAIVHCRRDSPLSSALHELRFELAEQAEALGSLLVEGVRPVACVVHPDGLAVPVTVTYALREGEEASEPSAQAARESLHRRLGLLSDRPLLRTCNALGGDGGGVGAGIPGLLRDTHLGLGPTGLSGGKASLVQGSYEYYHYLQPTGYGQKPGKYDDNGWGCAYRSLMSIVSWFRLQKYTSLPNPTHYEIQQTLVHHCGQEAADLLGKKKWLGSFDLSLFLEHALGVQCKTMSCNSGHDIGANARQLAHHFETQGTPVMIGGGQLAFTLLGVDFNDQTGEARFLIMDPHYVGPDELSSIQPKWVGWKSQDSVTHMGTKLFQKEEVYNLCLPQRPSCV